jgi:hypothetical protein
MSHFMAGVLPIVLAHEQHATIDSADMILNILKNPAFLAFLITLALYAYRTAAVQAWIGAKSPKLPKRLQWVAPIALGCAATACQGYLDGLRGRVLLEHVLAQAGQAGTMAIGFWHTYKRISSKP